MDLFGHTLTEFPCMTLVGFDSPERDPIPLTTTSARRAALAEDIDLLTQILNARYNERFSSVDVAGAMACLSPDADWLDSTWLSRIRQMLPHRHSPATEFNDIRLPVPLHIGFITIYEDDLMRSRLAEVPESSRKLGIELAGEEEQRYRNLARSKIREGKMAVPIDRVAHRVAAWLKSDT